MSRLVWLCLALLSSCAFANRANRPVWNAFESTMVPESDGAFYATLPLTVPVGLGAILVDTFIAHPIQVVDDAWDDTVEIWRHIDFEEAYYTESASLPFRAIGSPLVFLGSFLGRSTFDWESDEDASARRELAEQRRRVAALRYLQRIAAGEEERSYRSLRGVTIDEEIEQAVQAALAAAGAHARIRVYEAVSASDDPTIVDWIKALGDASAVVRYHVIEELPKSLEVPDEVLQRLLADPDEAVRERARRRWVQ